MPELPPLTKNVMPDRSLPSSTSCAVLSRPRPSLSFLLPACGTELTARVGFCRLQLSGVARGGREAASKRCRTAPLATMAGESDGPSLWFDADVAGAPVSSCPANEAEIPSYRS